MNIKPADKTIKALLKSGRQFMIPRFQRDYSWEKKNCEEFLDDIIKCLKCKDGKLETTPYFWARCFSSATSMRKAIRKYK